MIGSVFDFFSHVCGSDSWSGWLRAAFRRDSGAQTLRRKYLLVEQQGLFL